MSQIITTETIQSKPIASFAYDIQCAFVTIGQHIDFLLDRTGEAFIHKGYNGSDSWVPGSANDDKVMLKTFPWSQRLRKVLDMPADCTGGVGVLVRDEFMLPADMRCLWEEYGKAYRPSPAFPLYGVYPQGAKEFQLLIWMLGPGCDIFALPGVSESDFAARIETRSSRGEVIRSHKTSAAATTPIAPTAASPSIAGADPIVSAPVAGVTLTESVAQPEEIAADSRSKVVSALKGLVHRARF